MMTEARGASNAKAKRELGWTPRHASWRDGFATGLLIVAAQQRPESRPIADRPSTGSTPSYQDLRPGAFAIAYRMLGSASEAEDVVQEGLLRLHRALEDGEQLVRRGLPLDGGHAPGDGRAALGTRRRETYVGEWLPEPLVTSSEHDPARHAETADSLSLAFLVVLETLTPEQRAAFLLRDVFDYPYDRIAEIIGKSEAATRQIATRARRHVDERRPRYEASGGAATSSRSASSRPPRRATLETLESLLGQDVELHGDGGGHRPRWRARCTAGDG